MQFGYYIAKKLSLTKQQSFTRTITLLAIAAVSMSICVVIISFGVLLGFKKEIREKVSGYAGDISISSYQLTNGNENNILTISSSLIDSVSNVKDVESIFPYINKAGIIKSDSVLEGLVFKGVPYNYNFSFFKKHLKRGVIPQYADSTDSYEILLSEYTASVMAVDTGDRLNLFFIESSDVKRRRPKVIGIYNTGLEEFDKQFAIADIRVLQRVIGQQYNVAGGYEVKISDFSSLNVIQEQITQIIDYNTSARNVKEIYPLIFQWLELIDTNVYVLITLMFVVAIINVVTVLLILIIDRIPMIGLLKSLGATTQKVLRIFNWQGLLILLGGLLIGNLLALGLAYLQVNFKLIGLPADTYYMDAVPFFLPANYLFLINVGALFLCFFFTYVPVRIISKITPAQSIYFR